MSKRPWFLRSVEGAGPAVAALLVGALVWWLTRPRGTATFGPLLSIGSGTAGELYTGPGSLADGRPAGVVNASGSILTTEEENRILFGDPIPTVRDWKPITLYF